jgi:formylglycine-generating enzyme required for sulfatase activity
MLSKASVRWLSVAAAVAVSGLFGLWAWQANVPDNRGEPSALGTEPQPLPPDASDPNLSMVAKEAYAPTPDPDLLDLEPATLEEQRRVLLENMRRALSISDEQLTQVQAIFARSDWMGQGNPKVTRHPMSRTECLQIRARSGGRPDNRRICGAPYMVPLFEPNGSSPPKRPACIDQFEFPNVPCEYPVIWVQASEAVRLCEALGKRICDTHEWEGACAGALRDPDVEYAWGQRRLQMEYLHNQERPMVWAYGAQKNHALCATHSSKSPGCVAPTWQKCGSNTYPAGAFPQCVSPFGVYDLHGNAAEHMNLPTTPDERASLGGYGQTEMKGSWFIFSKYEAHPDDCRWRARNWHGSAITAKGSHRNYHLGFRCCKNIELGPAK